jgi:hypothetical protein
MAIQPVSQKLFDYLLDNVSGDSFEQLAKRIYGAAYGDDFVPLGGMHDGGADGFHLPHVSPGKKPDTFYQYSVTDSMRAKDKITQTINALRKASRTPRHVIYSTTENIPKQDVIVTEVFDEYQVLLGVRDRDRLRQLVNLNLEVNRLFLEFFRADIEAVKDSAKSLEGAVNHYVQDPTVFALLDYELKDRFSRDQLQQRILDSLIYWALRDTDPDASRFLGRSEIAEAIRSVFPTAESVLVPQLNARLIELSKKAVGGLERIRNYKSQEVFCLPFEMRKQLAERAIEESSLQSSFLDSIKQRFPRRQNSCRLCRREY